MRKCTDCKYCVQKQYGHSNYDVEETEAYCLLELNPKLPDYRSCLEEPALNFANRCPRFTSGRGPEIDVEIEFPFPDGYSDDAEIRELLKTWYHKLPLWKV